MSWLQTLFVSDKDPARIVYPEKFEPAETRESKKALDAQLYLDDMRAEHRAMKGGDDE